MAERKVLMTKTIMLKRNANVGRGRKRNDVSERKSTTARNILTMMMIQRRQSMGAANVVIPEKKEEGDMVNNSNMNVAKREVAAKEVVSATEVVATLMKRTTTRSLDDTMVEERADMEVIVTRFLFKYLCTGKLMDVGDDGMTN